VVAAVVAKVEQDLERTFKHFLSHVEDPKQVALQ